MTRLLVLLAAAALAACDVEPDPGDTCQKASDIVEPGSGKIGTKCDPFSPTGADTSPPNDYGGCFCTLDGTCPSGWQPHR
jgi:hypothetical protein